MFGLNKIPKVFNEMNVMGTLGTYYAKSEDKVGQSRLFSYVANQMDEANVTSEALKQKAVEMVKAGIIGEQKDGTMTASIGVMGRIKANLMDPENLGKYDKTRVAMAAGAGVLGAGTAGYAGYSMLGGGRNRR